MSIVTKLSRVICFAFALAPLGCGSSGVSSDEDARAAYQGLDASIDKAITLGFAGFNAASSANIPAQMANGNSKGTMTISGQVDHGASNNKTMNLVEDLAMYSDDGKITYDTTASAALGMSLKGIPTGTLNGTLNGTFHMTGDQTGDVTLSLTFSGTLQPNSMDATKVERKPGSTHITGTATSEAGVYQVDVTR